MVAPIRIGGRPWKVSFSPSESMPGVTGLCHYYKTLLEIQEGLQPFDEKDTVLHEVFHALLYCQGREQGGKVEETYVRALATGLVAVLQDNPEFAKWLCKPIPERTK